MAPVPGYRVLPKGPVKGGVVVLHEAFGVTPHIERVAEWLAGEGYAVVAPNLLASVGQLEALPQNKLGLDTGRTLIGQRRMEDVLGEIAACVRELGVHGKVGTVGYCWGGSLSFASAAQVPGVAAASAYYGGKLGELGRTLVPKCPVEVHLAELDRYIDFADAWGALQPLAPGVVTYAYAADHGFHRDDGVTFDAPAAGVARARTLAFFGRHVAVNV
jgi:carboxymethylenebutenolidase